VPTGRSADLPICPFADLPICRFTDFHHFHGTVAMGMLSAESKYRLLEMLPSNPTAPRALFRE
jgi:hypothetical protein